jgi:hypothetical protein
METKANLKKDLHENANTLSDVFTIVNKHYNTNTHKMGTITKGVLIANIDKLISMSGVKPK